LPSVDGGGPDLPGARPTATRSSAAAKVVIATIGNYSGIPGSVTLDAGHALQAWGRWVNDQGGVNGHPIEVLFFDDGGDLGRHQQLVKDAVENRGAVAIVGLIAPLTGQASVDYVTRNRIPVIGGGSGEPWFENNPMHFPTQAVGTGWLFFNAASTVDYAIQNNFSRFGVLHCVESASCEQAGEVWPEYIRQLGMEVVQVTGASIAQADFTAECLNFRNARAEVILINMDGNSVRRFAAACNRQGYHPTFMQPGEGVERAMLDDPNLDGLITASSNYPFLIDSAPRGTRYRSAVADYMSPPDNLLFVAHAWMMAEVFAEALSRVPGVVTNETLLRGLWSLNNEDFDGLMPPITYVEGATANQQAACYFIVAIDSGEFVSPDGTERHCRSLPTTP